MIDLAELEAIKQLKYKYFRCLDSKRWNEIAETFTETATAAYDNGKYSYEGRDAIVEFLSGALGDRDTISLHMGHHPELTLDDAASATGTWYFEDHVIFGKAGFRLRGAGFYHDRYAKIDGRWKIQHTGYVRTFEEVQTEAEGPGWKLTHYGDHLDPK